MFKHKLVSFFVLVLVSCAFFVAPIFVVPVAQAAQFVSPQLVAAQPAATLAVGGSSQSYVIKLTSSAPDILNDVGTGATRRFSFSAAPALQNIYTFNSAASLSALRAALAGNYEYLEPELAFHAHAGITLNDPGFTTDPANVNRQWALPKANFIKAWDKTTGSKSVRVAIIDTGIDQTHEDLRAGSFARGFDFLTNSDIAQGTDSDDNGHGTLVAGIIGATTNNSLGIAGAVWRVTLIPLKALDDHGSGSSVDISESIVWAADHDADIINMSLGGIGFAHDTTLANAISYAYDKNVVIVAAAGNDVVTTGGNLDKEPVFPVCDDNGDNMVIGVAATDQNDLKPEFSNFGKNCIDVTAPGRKILSTINHDPVTRKILKNQYAFASGTSMAVPYVTAEAVLIKAQSPLALNRQIRDRIIATADPVDSLNAKRCNGGSCDGLLGAGRINVASALAEVIKPARVKEGDVVKLANGQMYFINGGKRHLITPFVKTQRFASVAAKLVDESDLVSFPEGSFAEPLDGTLIMSNTNPTVFYMAKGFRLPVTAQVFKLRGFKFSDVHILTDTEINGWLAGSFLVPPDGTVMRGKKNPTMYWVVSGTLHPMNRGFYLDRGLNTFPVLLVADNDIPSFPRGEAFVR